jgi:hypothetical protein
MSRERKGIGGCGLKNIWIREKGILLECAEGTSSQRNNLLRSPDPQSLLFTDELDSNLRA